MEAHEISKVQELLYTTKVESVMAPNVIVLDPELTVAQVKEFMKSKRIAGAPVVQDRKIVGMVSVSDIIDAMERGMLNSRVSEIMVTPVKTVFKDVPATEAIANLGREGFGRLPVLDENLNLVGIVTTGTVIRSLLQQISASYEKRETERLPQYRASHIFQDILSDDTSLLLRYVVDDKDFTNAGKASSMLKKSLQRLGVSPSVIRRVAVAVYEAEMNLVIHTDVGGEIIVEIRKHRLKISAIDHGPGIENISQVLEPGYSTAPEWIREMGFGAGMGLANIRRCSDLMGLMSAPGAATKLDIIFLFDEDSSV